MKTRLIWCGAVGGFAIGSLLAQDATFDGSIRPIFESGCVSCHGAKKQKGGVRVDRRADLLAEDLVLPGNAAGSRLVAIVSGEVRIKRNAEEHLLPAEQIGTIRAWIDAGAR